MSSEKLRDILKKYWGYSVFRPLQEDIILSVLEKKDTLALLPTGGGKSICFQVPAMAEEGICLVVSPLIALMKDQVENLLSKGIPAAALYSGMSLGQIELILNQAIHQRIKFLYVSPERLETELFIEHFKQMKPLLLAVDEAHCISQWGYDFRPPYTKIADIRRFFPQMPVLALTATATPEVVKDIQEKLEFKQANVFQKSFERDNLAYFVLQEEDKSARLVRIIKNIGGSGLVYMRTRRRTVEMAEFLNRQGFSADYYHAGLDATLRSRKQEAWIQGKTPIMVATNAFGMGIDKPDVRFVVHLEMPDSLEAYFQEAGRAGRDGQKSYAVLLYHPSDKLEINKRYEQNFPPLKEVKKIYDALGNYYRVPLSSGAEQSFPFSLKEFSQACNQNHLIVYGALQILEKAAYIKLSENFSKSSEILFKAGKEDIYAFQVSHTNYDIFIKTLLRIYGGSLYHAYVNIDEKEIANKLNTSVQRVEDSLKKLDTYGFIDYQAKQEGNYIEFVGGRQRSDALFFSDEVYAFRQKIAIKKLREVIFYAEDTHLCKSKILVSYFGQTKAKRCGICNICLQKKVYAPLSCEEKRQIQEKIYRLFAHQNINLKTYVEAFPEYEEEKLLSLWEEMIRTKELQKTNAPNYFCLNIENE